MQIWQDRVYPQCTRGQSGFDHVSQSSQRAVMWAVTHYNDVSGQLRCLEMTRWRHVKAEIPDDRIWEVAQKHKTTTEAVKEILWLCQNHGIKLHYPCLRRRGPIETPIRASKTHPSKPPIHV